MDNEQYLKNIYEYIESIYEDMKTNSVEYERRLNVCKQCENLINGMCKICGCFVELRAVMNKNYCPSIVKLW